MMTSSLRYYQSLLIWVQMSAFKILLAPDDILSPTHAKYTHTHLSLTHIQNNVLTPPSSSHLPHTVTSSVSPRRDEATSVHGDGAGVGGAYTSPHLEASRQTSQGHRRLHHDRQREQKREQQWEREGVNSGGSGGSAGSVGRGGGGGGV